MKIHNNLPINSKTTRKSTRSHTGGVFGALLDSEIDQAQPVSDATSDTGQAAPMQHAWQALEDSVDLLDRAMQCMEDGGSPSPQLISDIEQLRCRLHQQVSAGGGTELRQADTLLAVEAERIRSMHS